MSGTRCEEAVLLIGFNRPDLLSEVIDRVRAAMPEAAITTDVIVGFRIPYIMGQDTERLDAKIGHLESFAEKVMNKL